MRLGIDVRPLQLQHSVRGIGKHLEALVVELLNKYGETDQLIFYIYEGLPNPISKLKSAKGKEYEIVVLPNYKERFTRLPTVIASSINIIRRVFTPIPSRLARKSDVLIGFDFMNGMPRKRDVKYYLVGYDLIPLMFRDDYLPRFKTNLKSAGLIHACHSALVSTSYRLALQLVRIRKYRILSISDSTKEQFVKYLGINPELIRTVYLGNPLDSTEFEMKHSALDRVKKFKKRSYLLFIGGNDPRRRIEDTVHAFNQLRGRGVELSMVFAGFDFQSLDTIVGYKTKIAIEQSSYRDDIHLLGYINDSEKKYLYENALCFVFPTISEGFGLPVLEAMQEGCPVISYDYPLSSIKEVAGSSAILTQPGMDPVYDAVLSLVSDKKLYEELVEDGFKNCKRFSWKKCASETIEHMKDPDF
ncbi:glycosyltransferase family 4 protein [Candidatus Saccharibacteria bacterium]|nr:glycosyltransferase family 4 protein [Candidatus Saccharibacteria bacterium]